jgi:hypothetical protein
MYALKFVALEKAKLLLSLLKNRLYEYRWVKDEIRFGSRLRLRNDTYKRLFQKASEFTKAR